MRLALIFLTVLLVAGCGSDEDPDASVMHLFDAAKPADQKVMAAVRIALRKPVGDLTRGDLDKVTELKVREAEISDVSLFVEMRNLEDLNLNKNKITDLTPLTKLANLKKLSVCFNQITDLSPVPQMKKLRELKIYYNQISDLKPISDMQHLQVLHIMNNKISDLKPLYGLKDLKEVHLNSNTDLNYIKISQLYIALPKTKVVHDTQRK